jgi:AraC-like DNA-binding protein
MYRERAAGTVPGAVLWTRTGGPERPVRRDAGQVRVLPDGCMDLIWLNGSLLVAGPDTVAQLVPGQVGDDCSGLRFAPGTAAAVLGVPAWELRDLRVPLEQLWSGRDGRSVRVLTERVRAAAEVGAAAGALEALVGEWVTAGERWDERVRGDDPVRRAVLSGVRNGVAVPGIASELGLSERQLRRRCLELFGYGPKVLARVLRLDRALVAARAGVGFARVAADSGYADQAHLAREVRALAGVTLGELLSEGRSAGPGEGSGAGAPEGRGGGLQGVGKGAKRSTGLPSGSCTTA